MRFLRPYQVEWSTVMKRLLLALLLVPAISFGQSVTQTDDERAIDLGQMYSAEFSAAGVLSAGTALVGIQTGTRPLMIGDRSYSSTEASLRVELFEVSFTGGTDVNRYNRNIVIGGTGSVAIKSGVTATPVTAITTANFIATSSANNIQLALVNDGARLVLKPQTQYVIRFTNTGAATATIGARFNYRDLQP